MKKLWNSHDQLQVNAERKQCSEYECEYLLPCSAQPFFIHIHRQNVLVCSSSGQANDVNHILLRIIFCFLDLLEVQLVCTTFPLAAIVGEAHLRIQLVTRKIGCTIRCLNFCG